MSIQNVPFAFHHENESSTAEALDPMHLLLVAADYLKERCQNRRLILYGTGREALKIATYLPRHGLDFEYFISNSTESHDIAGKKVRHYLDVAYENRDDIFVIIADDNECYGISRRKFLDLGLVEDLGFTYYKNVLQQSEPYHYDVTLSYSRIRAESGFKFIEGFELFGDTLNPDALKIVALGGSTTESTLYFIKGWAQYLADLLKKSQIPAVVYCGGINGYTSSQELLKLIRDVLPLEPDIVLSFSGLNDVYTSTYELHWPEKEKRPFVSHFQAKFFGNLVEQFPEKNRVIYYGLKNDKTASEVWLNNARMMHAVATEFGVSFLSFYQPYCYIGGYELTDSQRIIFSRWQNAGIRILNISEQDIRLMAEISQTITDEIKNYDYITDLTNIFSGHTNIYRDVAHVYEHGNQIIAQHIFHKIMALIEDRNK